MISYKAMDISPHSEVSYETKTLEAIQLYAQQEITRLGLHGLRDVAVEHVARFITDSMIFRLKARVWSDPDRRYRRTEKVSYTAAHPTWKHALVASLPENSFRRRWCHFFWDIPFDYQNTRVTEVIDVDAQATFPEMDAYYPENFGRVHYVTNVNRNRLTESYIG